MDEFEIDLPELNLKAITIFITEDGQMRVDFQGVPTYEAIGMLHAARDLLTHDVNGLIDADPEDDDDE